MPCCLQILGGLRSESVTAARNATWLGRSRRSGLDLGGSCWHFALKLKSLTELTVTHLGVPDIIYYYMAHQLNDTWVFWYAPRGRKAIAGSDQYDANLRELGEFNSVEEFFSYYCFLSRPSEVRVLA